MTREITSCDGNTSGPQSPLLNLPIELREEIYKQIFHECHVDDLPCNTYLEGRGDTGCWCGNGLSLTNHQFYNETRRMFYNCVRLIFLDPVSCERFFRKLGRKAEWVTSLKVTYEDIFSQACLFRDIFRYIGPNSNLRNLVLHVSSWDTEPDSPPLYFPSLQKSLWAARYDLSLRPARHPLTKLKSIMFLSVIGHPTVEMEEAIFKLSLEMEERARLEGKQLDKVVGKVVGLSPGKTEEWFYVTKIRPVRPE